MTPSRTCPPIAHAWVLAAAFSVGACGKAAEEAPSEPSSRPNVIFVVCDTLRADRMSTYGHFRATTPNLDALAATGTVVEHASAMSSWTLPSMSMLMTGEIKARADMAVLRTHVHVAEGFSAAGFHTGAVVANPVLDEKLHYHRGLDHFDIERTKSLSQTAMDIMGRGVDWIDSLEGEQPFFLWLHPVDPHHPFIPEGGAQFPVALEEEDRVGAQQALTWGREVFPAPLAPIPGPETMDVEAWAEITAARNLYDSEILQFDRALGELVAALKERGLFENTVIAITSDHGEGLWERLSLPDSPDQDPNIFFPALYRRHGLMLHDEQTHVPLVFHGPGVPKGKRWSQWIEHIDVVPTLYALANVPLLKQLPGRALFEEEGAEARGPLISVCSRSYSVTIDERWRAHFPRKYRQRKMHIPVELYDLEADPGERHCIDDPKRIAEMAEILQTWRTAHSPNDPDQKLDRDVWATLQALGYGGEIDIDAIPTPRAKSSSSAGDK